MEYEDFDHMIAPKREGPFEIEEVLGPVNYRLKLLKTWRIHDAYCDHTLKTKYMEEIFLDYHQNYWKEKKFTNIDDEDEDTNIISNGKDILLLKQCGKMNQHSPMMEIC